MKKITFKTLSILLVAVLLVAALPIVAFAEDVSPCGVPQCEHNYILGDFDVCEPHINEYHAIVRHEICYCIGCGLVLFDERLEFVGYGAHEFDDSVDPEVDMEGVCILCGDTIYW